MSLPILIKPQSFRLGLFYYFRFSVRSSIFYIIVFSIFISLVSNKIFAFKNDSLDVMNLRYDSLLMSEKYGMQKLFYKHYNDLLINNLGTFGSPFYYSHTQSLYNISFQKENNELKHKYYNIKGAKPFTNISYVNASRKEQLISISHMQQMGKLISFDFDFNKTSSPGIYNNQEANRTFLKANLKFNTKNNFYSAIFSNDIERNFYEENGGILNENNFEAKLYDDARNYEVNLPTSNSFYKRYSYNLDQNIRIFSIKNDTALPMNIYIGHQFSYNTGHRVFYDNEPQSDIYETILIDSLQSIDSIYNNNLSNTGRIGLNNGDLDINVFYQYDKLNYVQSYGIDTTYSNSYLGVEFKSELNTLGIFFIGKYGLNGYRLNDKHFELKLDQEKQQYLYDFSAGYFELEPNLNFVNYTSNHFDWKNYGFNKQKILTANFNLFAKKYQLEFEVHTKIIENILYYDSIAVAAQNNERILFSTFSLAKNYSFGNFYFRTVLLYQITSDKYIVPLPEIVGRQIFYYQKRIFKKALKIQLGMGASYSTGYYGYAYMPATSQFYIQNYKQLGYYPNVDIFLNTYLKRAQIFLKYEHINAGRSMGKSYQVPGYPQLNRSLKFGVSWNLFD